MRQLTFEEGERTITAQISSAFQDPQTRALTVRLTLTDAEGATLWRDYVRANPLKASFLQQIIDDETDLVLDDEVATRLVVLIRDACRR